MVEDRHFVSQTPAHAIGYKLMAVNICDLTEMGHFEFDAVSLC
jgi:thiamine monophosphate kinase